MKTHNARVPTDHYQAMLLADGGILIVDPKRKPVKGDILIIRETVNDKTTGDHKRCFIQEVFDTSECSNLVFFTITGQKLAEAMGQTDVTHS